MQKTNLEFRKGILFIRLNNNLDNKLINKLINEEGFKYLVFNINNLKYLNKRAINNILNYNNKLIHNNGKLILCEDNNTISRYIFKNKIPYITKEIEAFDLI